MKVSVLDKDGQSARSLAAPGMSRRFRRRRRDRALETRMNQLPQQERVPDPRTDAHRYLAKSNLLQSILTAASPKTVLSFDNGNHLKGGYERSVLLFQRKLFQVKLGRLFQVVHGLLWRLTLADRPNRGALSHVHLLFPGNFRPTADIRPIRRRPAAFIKARSQPKAPGSTRPAPPPAPRSWAGFFSSRRPGPFRACSLRCPRAC